MQKNGLKTITQIFNDCERLIEKVQHRFSMAHGRVKLCPLEETDIEQLRVLRNANAQWFCSAAEITTKQQAAWFANYKSKPNDYMFSVFHRDFGRWIGAVSLYDVQPDQQTAEFGRLVLDGKSVGEKGLGLDTTIAACKIGFEQLGLCKILLEVYNDNISAVKTYSKTGFVVTKEQVCSDDRMLLHMTLLKEKIKD